jgi:hypothetical protein
MKFFGVLALAIALIAGAVTGIVKLGYLHPDTERCNSELAYYLVQNRMVQAKRFTFPFQTESRPWLWEPGAQIAGPDGNVAPDAPMMWMGACVGKAAPRNENIRVSFDGLGMLLLVWLISTIPFGFHKRRWVGLAVLLLVAMPLIPHWTTSRLGDWAAWFRYLAFWLEGLIYFFVSWKLLNKPPQKAGAAPGQVVSVQPVVVK